MIRGECHVIEQVTAMDYQTVVTQGDSSLTVVLTPVRSTSPE